MNKLVMILVPVTMVVGSLQAQVPGFMGRRFALFAEPNPTPAIFVQNANNAIGVNPGGDQARTEKSNLLAMNYRPQVSLEFLVTRDVAIGVSASLLRIGTVRRYESTFSQPNIRDYVLDHDVIRGRSAGLFFKFYKFKKMGSIAPIGLYSTLAVHITQTNSYDNKKSTVKQFENDFLYPVVNYGIGKQTMIARNVVLKTGVEFGWAIVPGNYLKETKEDWDEQEYAGYNVHGSLLGYYIFNLNISLGYLPF
jgi:hypothetical protein